MPCIIGLMRAPETNEEWKTQALSMAETAIDRFLERRPLSGDESVLVGKLLGMVGQLPQRPERT